MCNVQHQLTTARPERRADGKMRFYGQCRASSGVLAKKHWRRVYRPEGRHPILPEVGDVVPACSPTIWFFGPSYSLSLQRRGLMPLHSVHCSVPIVARLART